MLKSRVWGTSSFDALDAHVYTLPCAAAFFVVMLMSSWLLPGPFPLCHNWINHCFPLTDVFEMLF